MQLGGQRAGQHPLQGFHPAPFAFPRRLRNSNLHPSHVPFNAMPIYGIPVVRRVGKRRSSLSTRYFHAALLLEEVNPERRANHPPCGSDLLPQGAKKNEWTTKKPSRTSQALRVVSHLATVDQTEVCPLSRGVMLQPLSDPLQTGLRFFHPPIPAQSTASLAVRLPAKQDWQPYGLTTFPACHTTDLGSTSPPAV
jgi:hypothetical protein